MRPHAASAGGNGDQGWLPGLPHVVVALAVWPVFGSAACIAGLLLATLASFVVYLPLTALGLNHGRPIAADASAPAITAFARLVMLALWTLTAWLGALLG